MVVDQSSGSTPSFQIDTLEPRVLFAAVGQTHILDNGPTPGEAVVSVALPKSRFMVFFTHELALMAVVTDSAGNVVIPAVVVQTPDTNGRFDIQSAATAADGSVDFVSFESRSRSPFAGGGWFLGRISASGQILSAPQLLSTSQDILTIPQIATASNGSIALAFEVLRPIVTSGMSIGPLTYNDIEIEFFSPSLTAVVQPLRPDVPADPYGPGASSPSIAFVPGASGSGFYDLVWLQDGKVKGNSFTLAGNYLNSDSPKTLSPVSHVSAVLQPNSFGVALIMKDFGPNAETAIKPRFSIQAFSPTLDSIGPAAVLVQSTDPNEDYFPETVSSIPARLTGGIDEDAIFFGDFSHSRQDLRAIVASTSDGGVSWTKIQDVSQPSLNEGGSSATGPSVFVAATNLGGIGFSSLSVGDVEIRGSVESVNVVVSPFAVMLPVSPGVVAVATSGYPATIFDNDGTQATAALTGPGMLSVIRNADGILSMKITGASAMTKITFRSAALTTLSDDGRFEIAGLSSNAPLSALNAPTLDLSGNLSLRGVSFLTLGNITTGRIDLGSVHNATVKLGDIAASAFTASGSLQALTVADWIGGSLTVTSIGTLNSAADFDANFNVASVNKLIVAGVLGGTSTSDVRTLRAGQFLGGVSAGTIQHAHMYAGVKPAAAALPRARSAFNNAKASIQSVMAHQFIDAVVAAPTINKINITGLVDSNPVAFGIAAERITDYRRGSVTKKNIFSKMKIDTVGQFTASIL